MSSDAEFQVQPRYHNFKLVWCHFNTNKMSLKIWKNLKIRIENEI